MPVEPIPEGAQTLTPYLVIDGAASAIDYYRRANSPVLRAADLPDTTVPWWGGPPPPPRIVR